MVQSVTYPLKEFPTVQFSKIPNIPNNRRKTSRRAECGYDIGEGRGFSEELK